MLDGGEPTPRSPESSQPQSSAHPTLDYHIRDTEPPPTPASTLAALLLKILAIYCFAQAAPGLASVFVGLRELLSSGMGAMATTTAYWLALAFAGALIFWNADRWAPRLISDSGTLGSSINTVDVQAIALSVLGCYLLAHALPLFARDALIVTTEQGWRGATFGAYLQTFITHVVEVALGLVLFLRARGIALLWHKIRSTPRGDEAANAEAP